jgi:uncharacterized protein (TIGR00730 family)
LFCASSTGTDPAFAAAARGVGTLLAARKVGLVYGGGNIGLMGICADAALLAGGEVIGIIPRGLEEQEVAHRGLTELYITGSMHERKQRMHELSDGFIVLPGGFGTLDELFETLTWAQLSLHRKPVGLLDVNGFFQPLMRFIDHQVACGVLRPQHRDLLRISPDIQSLVDDLLHAAPPRP